MTLSVSSAVKPRNVATIGFDVAKINELNFTCAAVRRCVEKKFATVVTLNRSNQGKLRRGMVYTNPYNVQRLPLVTCKISTADAQGINAIRERDGIESSIPIAILALGAVKPRYDCVSAGGIPVAKLYKLNVTGTAVRRCVENKLASIIACAGGKQGNGRQGVVQNDFNCILNQIFLVQDVSAADAYVIRTIP